MATKELVLNIDSNILSNADALFDEMGIDTETAIKIFLKRTIKDRRLPFDLVAGQTPSETTMIAVEPLEGTSIFPETTKRSGSITKEMRQKVWDVFKKYNSNRDNDLQGASRYINKQTGMNTGSAFIYLYILKNLIDGSINKRTLKFDDLIYFLERIKSELSDAAYQASLRSLRISIPYWEEKLPGSFAEKVRKLLGKL